MNYFGTQTFFYVKDLSVEITCLCRLLIYTDNDFHLILGFNLPLQTMVFYLKSGFKKKVIYTDNGFSPKPDFTKK